MCSRQEEEELDVCRTLSCSFEAMWVAYLGRCAQLGEPRMSHSWL